MEVGTPEEEDAWPALVIGAGFAGLAAATRLEALGVRTLVLEATERVGGRARTDYSLLGGAPLELGALMVHGRRAVTHQWLATHGLHTRPLPTMQRSCFLLGRRPARAPWLAFPFHPVVGLRSTLRGTVTLPRELHRYRGPDRSLARYLEERRVDPASRLFLELLWAHVYAADPDSIGIRGSAEEDLVADEPFGYANFQVEEGYSALAERVARRLPRPVRLGSPVRAVEHSDSGVRVEVSDQGGGARREYRSRAAIVSVPLGVLKAGAIRFDPPLPGRTRQAIEAIAMGDGMTVQMRLREPTLPRPFRHAALLWGGTASAFHLPRVGRPGPPPVVAAFAVGREARRRSVLPLEGMVDAAMQEWESIGPPGVRLGSVDRAVVHPWPVDPWTRGAYSYLPPGVGLSARRDLAAPPGPRLFLAGEATAIDGNSATVAGAIGTGLRAADELHAVLRADDRAPRGSPG